MPRPLTLLLALATGFVAVMPARAQNLQELYEAARAYDATYLAARALADSAQYRLEQSRALQRPSASLSGSLTRAETDPAPSTANPSGSSFGSTTTAVTVTGRQPLFNKSNLATVSQAERTFEIARADLETAEQDLIVRVSQAYFDVLAAQDTLAALQANKKAMPSSWPRPSAISRSAPPPSPTRARCTGPLRQGRGRTRSRPTTTCAPSASRSTSWWAATAFRPSRWPCRWPCRRWLAGRRGGVGGNRRASTPRSAGAQLGLDVARLETEKARAPEVHAAHGRLPVGSPRASGSTSGGQRHHLHRPASACSSTCRCTPAIRCRTASRKRCAGREVAPGPGRRPPMR
jgi:outer membrane protein